MKVSGYGLAWFARKMRFVVNWQGCHFANGAGKKIFICFGFANGSYPRGFLSNCLGLRQCNLLLNQFEILKRLEFHQPMVPQAAQTWMTDL